MISTIYLDMDDVLTDFSNYYHMVIGIDPRDIRPDQWEDNWHKFIDGGHFLKLPMFPKAQKLLDYVASTGIKTEILSSTGGPNFFEEICAQKTEWLLNNGINYHVNFVPGKKYKTQFATPNRLLIDDQESIILDFVAAGGLGITHVDADDTIATVMLLKEALGHKKYE